MFTKMTEKLDASIKTRVAPSTKEALERIAASRHLDVSDIVREAVRDLVAKSELADQPQPEQPTQQEAA